MILSTHLEPNPIIGITSYLTSAMPFNLDKCQGQNFAVSLTIKTFQLCSAKCIGSYKPVHFAQADLSRSILLLVNFHHFKGTFHIVIHKIEFMDPKLWIIAPFCHDMTH